MIKREHVLMICVGVLLLSCVYLLWDNKRLKKSLALKPQDVVVNKQTPEPETEAVDAEVTEEETTEANNGMDYYVNENIPDDLKEELNNLNLEDDGDSYEETLGEPIEETLGEPIEETLGEPIEETLGEPIEETLGEPIEETLGEPIEETLGEPIEETITNQIEDFVEEIMIDTKPENNELLDLELQLEQKLKGSLKKETIYTEESLNAMNLKQLADICRENGLKIKGKKSEIVERILSM
mgnify:CR=1 FL=1